MPKEVKFKDVAFKRDQVSQEFKYNKPSLADILEAIAEYKSIKNGRYLPLELVINLADLTELENLLDELTHLQQEEDFQFPADALALRLPQGVKLTTKHLMALNDPRFNKVVFYADEIDDMKGISNLNVPISIKSSKRKLEIIKANQKLAQALINITDQPKELEDREDVIDRVIDLNRTGPSIEFNNESELDFENELEQEQEQEQEQVNIAEEDDELEFETNDEWKDDSAAYPINIFAQFEYIEDVSGRLPASFLLKLKEDEIAQLEIGKIFGLINQNQKYYGAWDPNQQISADAFTELLCHYDEYAGGISPGDLPPGFFMDNEILKFNLELKYYKLDQGKGIYLKRQKPHEELNYETFSSKLESKLGERFKSLTEDKKILAFQLASRYFSVFTHINKESFVELVSKLDEKQMEFVMECQHLIVDIELAQMKDYIKQKYDIDDELLQSISELLRKQSEASPNEWEDEVLLAGKLDDSIGSTPEKYQEIWDSFKKVSSHTLLSKKETQIEIVEYLDTLNEKELWLFQELLNSEVSVIELKQINPTDFISSFSKFKREIEQNCGLNFQDLELDLKAKPKPKLHDAFNADVTMRRIIEIVSTVPQKDKHYIWKNIPNISLSAPLINYCLSQKTKTIVPQLHKLRAMAKRNVYTANLTMIRSVDTLKLKWSEDKPEIFNSAAYTYLESSHPRCSLEIYDEYFKEVDAVANLSDEQKNILKQVLIFSTTGRNYAGSSDLEIKKQFDKILKLVHLVIAITPSSLLDTALDGIINTLADYDHKKQCYMISPENVMNIELMGHWISAMGAEVIGYDVADVKEEKREGVIHNKIVSNKTKAILHFADIKKISDDYQKLFSSYSKLNQFKRDDRNLEFPHLVRFLNSIHFESKQTLDLGELKDSSELVLAVKKKNPTKQVRIDFAKQQRIFEAVDGFIKAKAKVNESQELSRIQTWDVNDTFLVASFVDKSEFDINDLNQIYSLIEYKPKLSHASIDLSEEFDSYVPTFSDLINYMKNNDKDKVKLTLDQVELIHKKYKAILSKENLSDDNEIIKLAKDVVRRCDDKTSGQKVDIYQEYRRTLRQLLASEITNDPELSKLFPCKFSKEVSDSAIQQKLESYIRDNKLPPPGVSAAEFAELLAVKGMTLKLAGNFLSKYAKLDPAMKREVYNSLLKINGNKSDFIIPFFKNIKTPNDILLLVSLTADVTFVKDNSRLLYFIENIMPLYPEKTSLKYMEMIEYGKQFIESIDISELDKKFSRKPEVGNLQSQKRELEELKIKRDEISELVIDPLGSTSVRKISSELAESLEGLDQKIEGELRELYKGNGQISKLKSFRERAAFLLEPTTLAKDTKYEALIEDLKEAYKDEIESSDTLQKLLLDEKMTKAGIKHRLTTAGTYEGVKGVYDTFLKSLEEIIKEDIREKNKELIKQKLIKDAKDEVLGPISTQINALSLSIKKAEAQVSVDLHLKLAFENLGLFSSTFPSLRREFMAVVNQAISKGLSADEMICYIDDLQKLVELYKDNESYDKSGVQNLLDVMKSSEDYSTFLRSLVDPNGPHNYMEPQHQKFYMKLLLREISCVPLGQRTEEERIKEIELLINKCKANTNLFDEVKETYFPSGKTVIPGHLPLQKLAKLEQVSEIKGIKEEYQLKREDANGFKLKVAEQKIKEINALSNNEYITTEEITQLNEHCAKAKKLDDARLLDKINGWSVNRSPDTDPAELVAYMAEYLHRVKGLESGPPGSSFEINTTQYLALYSMIKYGKVAGEIGTGEGKTRIMMLNLACQWARGKTVDFCTSDLELASRDYLDFKPFFDSIGAKTSFIRSSSFIGNETTDSDYQIDGINFSDAANLQLFRNSARSEGMQAKVIQDNEDKRCLVLDEADRTFFDAMHVQYNNSTVADKSVKNIGIVYTKLIDKYIEIPTDGTTKPKLSGRFVQDFSGVEPKFFAERMRKAIRDEVKPIDVSQIPDKYWLQWHQSLMGITQRELNIDYDIAVDQYVQTPTGLRKQAKAIVKIDGRQQKGSKFSNGMQQLLHAYLNACLTRQSPGFIDAFAKVPKGQSFSLEDEKQILYSSNSKTLMDDYVNSTVNAVTGTIGNEFDIDEFQALYQSTTDGKIEAIKFPRHAGFKAEPFEPFLCNTRERKEKLIKAQVETAIKNKQPLLLICKDDKESAATQKIVDSYLRKLKSDFKTQLIGSDTENEGELISKAGKPIDEKRNNYHITISTSMIGRGTDIKIDHKKTPKGLRVGLTYLPNYREMYQIYGRTGRQGQAGAAQMMLEIEDLLPIRDIAKALKGKSEIQRLQVLRTYLPEYTKDQLEDLFVPKGNDGKYALNISKFNEIVRIDLPGFIKRRQDAIDRDSRIDRLVKFGLFKLKDELHQTVFKLKDSQSDSPVSKRDKELWQVFLLEFNKTLNEEVRKLKANLSDPDNTESATNLMSTTLQRIKIPLKVALEESEVLSGLSLELREEMIQKIDDYDVNEVITKLLSDSRAKTFKLTQAPAKHTRHEKALAGSASRFSLGAYLSDRIKGPTHWFPNVRAWMRGEGILFADTKTAAIIRSGGKAKPSFLDYVNAFFRGFPDDAKPEKAKQKVDKPKLDSSNREGSSMQALAKLGASQKQKLHTGGGSQSEVIVQERRSLCKSVDPNADLEGMPEDKQSVMERMQQQHKKASESSKGSEFDSKNSNQ